MDAKLEEKFKKLIPDKRTRDIESYDETIARLRVEIREYIRLASHGVFDTGVTSIEDEIIDSTESLEGFINQVQKLKGLTDWHKSIRDFVNEVLDIDWEEYISNKKKEQLP